MARTLMMKPTKTNEDRSMNFRTALIIAPLNSPKEMLPREDRDLTRTIRATDSFQFLQGLSTAIVLENGLTGCGIVHVYEGV